MKKAILTNIALLCVTLVVMFFAFEFALRLVYPMGMECTYYDPVMGYELIPNWEGWQRNPQFLVNEYVYTRKFNSLGYNDYEPDLEKLKGEHVIVAIGDSFTYGSGVIMENTWPKVLERSLKQEKPSSVINMGVGSYSLDTYFKSLKYKSEQFSPDMAIIAFYMGNDINDQHLYANLDGNLVEKYEPEHDTKMKLRRWLLRNSHAWSFTLRAIDQTLIGDFLRDKGIFFQRQLPLQADHKAYDKRIEKSSLILDAFKEEAEKRNIDLLFVIVPFREQVDDRKYNELYGNINTTIGRWEFQQNVTALLDQKNITYINLLPKLREVNQNNSLYYEYDGHFRKKGYELMGNIIADYLISEPENNTSEV
ncbi:MAG: SGNH/GDSL hydrolase family protein [Candidatus Nanoarchaeia archaeon]